MYNSIKHVATDASDDSNIDIKFQERVFSFMVRKTREDALKTRQSIMDVASSFNIDSKIVGHVEKSSNSNTNEVIILSQGEEFVYN